MLLYFVVHFSGDSIIFLLGPHALQLSTAVLSPGVVQVQAEVVQLLELGLHPHLQHQQRGVTMMYACMHGHAALACKMFVMCSASLGVLTLNSLCLTSHCSMGP